MAKESSPPVDPGRAYRPESGPSGGGAVSFDKGRDHGQATATLEAWLRHRTEAERVSVRELRAPEGAGISNETLLFDAEIVTNGVTASERLVLRVSPEPEKRLCNNTLFETQARLLRVLSSEGLARVPTVRWFDDDPQWFGRPFFVMERAEGRVPISEPVYNAGGWLFDASPTERRVAWQSAIDELIRIHQVPPDKLRFLPGGAGNGSAFDQVLEAIRAEYDWACAGVAHPIVDRLWGWLDANRPPSPPDGLSWGDARIGNMMFGDDFHLNVVLDWELVSLGGSIMDLGWWLFFDEVHSVEHPRLEGLGGREETIEQWVGGTGLSAEHLDWYEILAAVRLATLVIRAMTMFGIKKPNDTGVFVRLAYERLGWGEPR